MNTYKQAKKGAHWAPDCFVGRLRFLSLFDFFLHSTRLNRLIAFTTVDKSCSVQIDNLGLGVLLAVDLDAPGALLGR
jgi:hypothetical protein